eukprot:jgi/Bigna1/87292/estExt_fgenesh1_pg.C_180196
MKARVDASPQKPSNRDVANMLRRFGFELSRCERLHSGYSGENYKVVGKDGTHAVLKLKPNVSEDNLKGEIRILEYLRKRNFAGACTAIPMDGEDKGSSKGNEYVTSFKGIPYCVLRYMEGVPPIDFREIALSLNENTVLRNIGKELAALHSVAVTPDAKLRDLSTGGLVYWRNMFFILILPPTLVCRVATAREHLDGIYLEKFDEGSALGEHTFFKFYQEELVNLIDCLNNDKLPRGIIHGDPFLDNILLDEKSGNFVAFIDWEDTTVGPYLFDLACAIIGTLLQCKQDKSRPGTVQSSHKRIYAEEMSDQRGKGPPSPGGRVIAHEANLLTVWLGSCK